VWNNNEIAVETNGAALDLRVFNQAGSQIHFSTVTPQSGCDWYGDLGGGTGVALPWEVLTFEFNSSSDVMTVYTYTPGYKASQPLSFYYPSASTATDHRVRFVLNTTTERVRAQWPATSSQFLNTLLGDATWVWPYDDDAFCASTSCAVTTPSAGPFLALVTAVPAPGAPADYTFHDSDVTMSGETWVWGESGQVLRFRAGRALVVDGTLTANGVTFRRGTIGLNWTGIRVADGTFSLTGGRVERADVGIRVYEPATATITDATIALNDTGLDVRTRQGVTVAGGTFEGNGTGVKSHFADCFGISCPCLTNCRSRFTLEASSTSITSIIESTGHGIYALNTEAELFDVGIKDCSGSGIVIVNSIIDPFQENVVQDNGDPEGYGVLVLSAGEFFLSPAQAVGLNSITANELTEVFIELGGAAFIGSDLLNGHNVLADPGSGQVVLYNQVKNPWVIARYVWWGRPSGPLGTEIFGLIDYLPFLDCDPTSGSGCLARGALAIRDHAGDRPGTTNGALTWLGEEIRRLRAALAAAPDAPGAAQLVRDLLGAQRIDRADVLGERSATTRLLAELRTELTGPALPSSLRPTAEAALVAEVLYALTQEEYNLAGALLEGFRDEVRDADERHQLSLFDAYLRAQSGRYAEAAAQVLAVAEETPRPVEARALRELAEVFAERADEDTVRVAPLRQVIGSEASPPAIGRLSVSPNPISAGSGVTIEIDARARVRLTVVDILGRSLVVLHDGTLDAASHDFWFDASALPTGLYVVRAVVEPLGLRASALTRRITVIR
jgi:hypothetical protein